MGEFQEDLFYAMNCRFFIVAREHLHCFDDSGGYLGSTWLGVHTGVIGQTHFAIIGAWVWRANSSRCEDVSCTLTDCWITALRESTIFVLSPLRNHPTFHPSFYQFWCVKKSPTTLTHIFLPNLVR